MGRLASGPNPLGALGSGRLASGAGPGPKVPTWVPTLLTKKETMKPHKDGMVSHSNFTIIEHYIIEHISRKIIGKRDT